MDEHRPRTRQDLPTEQQHPGSHRIDGRPLPELLEIINAADRTVAERVREALPDVARAVELAVATLQRGGHVFYLGAGTSGRLGVLDASEVPPTFSAPRDWFRGVIAGGREALVRSVEGAEDHPADAVRDLQAAGFGPGDLLVGVTSSGATPYVVGGLCWARELGARTVYLICNPAPPLEDVPVDVLIAVVVGPEIVTGSTRMKSGTATKLVLNMLSTATMIRLGKVYGNLMVDLDAVNAKLVDRGTRIVRQLTGLSYEQARERLFAADREVKTAVVMTRRDCSAAEARDLLRQAGGFLRRVIGDAAGQ